MPFDGSGNFNRVMRWQNDASAAIKIRADRHDMEDDNLASGLSSVITKDGQTQPTNDLPMNGKKLINLGAPTNPTDAATKGYADSVRSFNTAIKLSGAVPEARIEFTQADIGFGARVAGTPADTLNRWVWNDKPDLSGADVAYMDETGKMALGGATIPVGSSSGLTAGAITLDLAAFNSFYSTAWKAAADGYGGYIYLDKATGIFSISTANGSVDAGEDLPMAQRLGFDPTLGTHLYDIRVTYGDGLTSIYHQYTSQFVDFYKIAGAYHFRWVKTSDGLASGTGAVALMTLDDAGGLAVPGTITSGQIFQSTASSAVLATGAAGIVYLRPNGPGSPAGETYVNTDGRMTVAGTVHAMGGLAFNASNTMILSEDTGSMYLTAASGSFQTWNSTSGNWTWYHGSVAGFGLEAATGHFAAYNNARKPGGGSWINSTSDARAKTVLGDYDHGLDAVLALHPVRYVFKGNDTPTPPMPDGVADLDKALVLAEQRRPELAPALAALSPRLHDPADEVARRFQQLSGATMAKGTEDTAFYRYARFIALNEVGFDAGEFGIGLEDFHALQTVRQEHWPLAMTSLSTHDTKRGEDVRARLAVLADIGDEWERFAASFVERSRIANLPFAYFLAQTLIGVGPVAQRERLHAYAEKAMREASQQTSWTSVDEAYEESVQAAVDLAYDHPELRDAWDRVLALVEQPGLVQRTRPEDRPADHAGHPGHLPGDRAVG